jgi:glycine reductase complex component B subunit gamma
MKEVSVINRKTMIIHYLNQFFGQIGGEEKGDTPPIIKEGPLGPGLALQQFLGNEAEIIATVICGDNYYAENIEKTTNEILKLLESYDPNVLIAGPAFGAGRYGTACGALCKMTKEKLGIPAVTAMFPENPAVDLYKRDVFILPTGESAGEMREVLQKLGDFALKLALNKEIGFPEEEGYIPQGYRINVFAEKTGAERAVQMLLAKLQRQSFVTELPMPVYNRIDPAPPLKELKNSVIALVTSGGIVPLGNPDHIESHNASKFKSYLLGDATSFTGENYESVHGGYDNVYANEDPNRIVPLDVMRELESEGTIKKLHPYYYVTVGNTTAVRSASSYGEAIGKELKEANVDGVILTST